MKRFAVAALVLSCALLLSGALLLLAFLSPMRCQGGIVLLKPGFGAREVAAELAAQGVVAHPRLFLAFARVGRLDRHFRAGRYAIPPRPSMRSLLALLRAGPNVRERVTIPEGSRDDQIAGLLSRTAGVDSVAFLGITRDSSSARRFAVPGPTLQGYLFPDTYDVPFGMPAVDAASMFVNQYHRIMTPTILQRADSVGMDERDVVTLASIIEAETALPEERPRISAVYQNRLRAGWNLEADPTVRFATGNKSGDISIRDLASDSPYNTYRIEGLPPGPIGNPGRASLLAALFPTNPCDDFFFVATGAGGHRFSRTASEHAQAVAEFRRREESSRGKSNP